MVKLSENFELKWPEVNVTSRKRNLVVGARKFKANIILIISLILHVDTTLFNAIYHVGFVFFALEFGGT